MKNVALRKASLSLTLALVLILILVAPALAATQLSLKVVEVIPGGLIKLQVANMPSNTEFTVRMGPAGSKGVGGNVVAHFDSGAGGTQEYWFEVHAVVRSLSFIDVRVEGGTYFGYTTFNNSKALTSGGGAVSPTPVPPSTGGPTTPSVSTSPNLQVVNSQQGGWVKVLFTGLPANKTFTVRIGMAGTRAANPLGYVVAHFDTDNLGSQAGTFEIPFPLRAQSRLDFSIETTGAFYFVSFDNVDK